MSTATITGPPPQSTGLDPDAGEDRLLGALVMRAGFGGEVNHRLVQSMLRAPIIAVPRRNSVDWIFLTGPRTPMSQSTIADLIAAKVWWYDDPGSIPFPSTHHEDSRWVQCPEEGAALPEWAALVGAIRRALTGAW
ncbi:hypothetical protein GCM10022243_32310 [Saccharothrix violaceirubra]|uniref:Uncharacterized protein n=1 Tax=Saccharothrix violaceirubra TaxID=413306 RepID=A0A7W7T5A3_9PSEU|nr:hypothetical protein [Saccharothrix violaceirubra]MBB4966854.1 hypothetical protein [Saccharothrix violaceirubra]